MAQIRQWTLLTVVAILAILAGGYFLLVQPKADKAAEVRAAAEAQQLANVSLTQEIERLKKQAQDLPRQQARLAAFASRIPNNPALPSLIRALTDAADTAGVELVSLSPAQPGPLAAAAPAPAAPGAPAPAPGAVSAAALTEPLYAIPLTLSVRGGYVQIQQFFSNIEDLQRTILVGQFALTPATTTTTSAPAGGLTAAIIGQVFMVLPPAAAVPSPVAPVSPAPAQPVAPAATTSPTTSPTPAQ